LAGSGRALYREGLALKDAVKSQDVGKMRAALEKTEKQLGQAEADARLLGWTQFVPVAGGYGGDGFAAIAAGKEALAAGKILLLAVEPYADILGLKGQGSFTGGTAEERLAKIVETFDKVTPQLEQIASRVKAVRRAIDRIDARRYPENFRGQAVRSQITALKETVVLLDDLLNSAQPLVKKLPSLLGMDGERRYLVLFQNDAELRPTGGFITAYAFFRVERGKIHFEFSDDIYKLDETMTRHVAPPEPIEKYLNVYGWRMRDANFSPDFWSSMRTFEDLYAVSLQRTKFDGIIAVDTQVLAAMMEVLGPVRAYGTEFTTKKVDACNCPMIIWELEKYADEPKAYERGSRKDMIGVLLSEIMRQALSSPRQVYSRLFLVGLEQARQKHVLVYLHDEDGQKGLEALNFAGRIKTYGGDYLHVNDANLAGAKSNLFVTAAVKQEVTITNAGAEETLVIEYRYPRQGDNCSLERKEGLCLAGIYRDYLRVYLPAGAEVLEAKGFESKTQTYRDLDHLVLAGYFTVVPQGAARVQIKYKVPGDFQKRREYKSLIQKQPGTDGNKYKITVNGKAQEFTLTEDKEILVKL
jgi:hypothetical protein